MRDWEAYVRRRLALGGWRPDRERRVIRELAAQLADFYREGLARGLDAEDADAFARRQIGDWQALSEAVRKAAPSGEVPRLDRWAERGGRHPDPTASGRLSVGDFLRDLLMAVRGLRRQTGFSLIVTVTLALALGASTAVFTVVHGVVINPLPYPDSNRLVRLWHSAPGADIARIWTSLGVFHYYRETNRVFENLVGYRRTSSTLLLEGRPIRVSSAVVSHDFFAVFLGGPPQAGRTFQPADEQPGAEPVVVISDAFWISHLGSDPEAVGRRLRVDGRELEVVGILPPGFDFPDRDIDMWSCLRIDASRLRLGNFSTETVGRLRPGFSVQDARRELQTLIPRLEERYPGPAFDMVVTRGRLTAQLTPLKGDVVGDVTTMLWVLLGTVGFVLIIACANVANLFLVRAESRSREMAVRTALGAGRRRIVGHFLTESLLLVTAGGALGLGLAALGVRTLVLFGPPELPRLHEVGVGAAALAFCAAVSLGAGILFACAPLLTQGRAALVQRLADGSRGATAGRGRTRLRRLLVVSEVAMALVLLVGAGLMIRTLRKLQSVDPGFMPSSTLSLRIDLPQPRYSTSQAVAGFHREVALAFSALVEVESVGAVDCLPLTGCGGINPLYERRVAKAPGETPPAVRIRIVQPGYFDALGIPLLAGRLPDFGDQEQLNGAVVVSRTLADRFWPGADPLGREVYPDLPQEGTPWYRVVGVVGDVLADGLHRGPSEVIYLPLLRPDGRHNEASLVHVLRTTVPPSRAVRRARAAVASLDPELPVTEVREIEEIMAAARAPTVFAMSLMVVAAGVALLLGAVGVYGVLSFGVSQRRGEIGIRMAMGADRGAVNWMILRQGVAVALIGIAIGLAGAAALTRLMSGLLFGVEPLDPPTYLAVAATLIVVSGVASYLPARRAAAVDPVVALRNQ